MYQKTPVPGRVILLSFVLTILGGILLYYFYRYNPTDQLYSYLNSDANSYVFIILMALLPLAGFPISIFLIAIGMMFGIPAAIGITGIVILFHLVATYSLVHSFVRPSLVRVLKNFDLKIPQLPGQRRKRIAFVFMILPGIPYTVKNYLLALAEMPFQPYVAISWFTQFILSIPFIVLGRGVIQLDPLILAAAAVFILLGLAIQHFLRKRYKKYSVQAEE